MNFFKRVFCRLYQTAFRAALPFLPYRELTLLHHTDEIAPLLTQKGISTVLLVTDSFLHGSGATRRLEASLTAAGVRAVIYDKTRANPTVQNVNEGTALYRREGCEALIAFGGGSSMDCAKGIGARIAYPKKQLGQLKGLLKVLRRIPLLIAVPTTAGTGSETTLAAVITDGEKKHKYTMNDFTLIPRYAVLDPEVTRTLPPALTATTGMDALTHAVEAYIGRSTTRTTRRLASEAVALIFENIETAYRNGNDLAAREAMLTASYRAGLAFSQSYVGYIHAVAHSLGGAYNIPHGLANAVLMPYVLKAYGRSAHKKLHALGVVAGVSRKEDSHAAGAEKFIAAIEAKNAAMGIPTHLPGIREDDIPTMAHHAAKEANPLYPVPRLMTAENLTGFYRAVALPTERADKGTSEAASARGGLSA